MAAEIPAHFTGYGAENEAAGKAFDLTKIEYTPKVFNELDVVVKISHCGICGSDCHVLTNGWPRPTQYPAIVGHEIIGTVVKAGSKSGHTVGTRVGIGAQGSSCLECEFCEKGKEQFCEKGMGGTYQGKFEDGSIAQGGYADYTCQRGRFAIPIPDGLESAVAAPLMCAGATVYSPLKRHGAGPGKKVGIVGIGGLGHLAIQFSLALGAETYAFSQSDSKKSDAEKLGLKPENFIIAKDVKATLEKWNRNFDLIICTNSGLLPLEELYFPLLRPEGVICLCGLPEEKLPAMFGQVIIGRSISLAGSLIAGTKEIKEMLQLAVDKDVKPWIETRPMAEAAKACQDFEKGLPRYRFVLEN